MEGLVVLNQVPHHVGILYLLSQDGVDDLHVAEHFQNVADRCRLSDGVEYLDDPVEQIKGEGVIVLGEGSLRDRVK